MFFCFFFGAESDFVKEQEQLKEGLNRLVQQGDESGVWNVIACASSNWVHNVNQIETLTHQLNEYKVCSCFCLLKSAMQQQSLTLCKEQEKERLLTGGIFQSEESRMGSSSSAAIPSVFSSGDKRKYEDIGMTHGATSRADHDIWSEFQTMMMSSGGNKGIYDAASQMPSNSHQTL